jgi:hypothetical protein
MGTFHHKILLEDMAGVMTVQVMLTIASVQN